MNFHQSILDLFSLLVKGRATLMSKDDLTSEAGEFLTALVPISAAPLPSAETLAEAFLSNE